MAQVHKTGYLLRLERTLPSQVIVKREVSCFEVILEVKSASDAVVFASAGSRYYGVLAAPEELFSTKGTLPTLLLQIAQSKMLSLEVAQSCQICEQDRCYANVIDRPISNHAPL